MTQLFKKYKQNGSLAWFSSCETVFGQGILLRIKVPLSAFCLE